MKEEDQEVVIVVVVVIDVRPSGTRAGRFLDRFVVQYLPYVPLWPQKRVRNR